MFIVYCFPKKRQILSSLPQQYHFFKKRSLTHHNETSSIIFKLSLLNPSISLSKSEVVLLSIFGKIISFIKNVNPPKTKAPKKIEVMTLRGILIAICAFLKHTLFTVFVLFIIIDHPFQKFFHVILYKKNEKASRKQMSCYPHYPLLYPF